VIGPKALARGDECPDCRTPNPLPILYGMRRMGARRCRPSIVGRAALQEIAERVTELVRLVG
jgi:hypothetical protein